MKGKHKHARGTMSLSGPAPRATLKGSKSEKSAHSAPKTKPMRVPKSAY